MFAIFLLGDRMIKDLTRKQEETLTFIKKYMVAHGYPPSVREICSGMNLSSPATAHSHLKELEAKGYIRKENAKFRTIELLVDNEFDVHEGKRRCRICSPSSDELVVVIQ